MSGQIFAKKDREKYGIDAMTFVRVWAEVQIAGGTLDEVVSRLSTICGKSVPRSIVLARASYYRREGCSTLKTFPRNNPRKLDMKTLNSLTIPA